MPKDFNQQIIEEFRANRGRVGGPFEGGRLLLLTTTGARTGNKRTNPLAYLPDGDRFLVIASAGGAPSNPDWLHNLIANPRVTVEDGVFTREADATVLQGEERDLLFARAVEADPGWAAYQAKTERIIPVVALSPIPAPPVVEGSPGEELVAIHGAFRSELGRIRREVAESGPVLGAQLRVNCLTVCQGLHFHHGVEDAHVFPAVQEKYPELAEPLARLREEHGTVSRLLDQLKAAVTDAGADRATVAAEVERLTAELEAHLDHEESYLVPALNSISFP
ncbi:nitroreductase family deazaflavin-dependent oxidoreductase [Actinomadura barringtoniae]|uniref:Nitroreductase family deazaflavin-dependent oxidoreductase n=1 Tax=Actinomadura barringtoniae TaxID=1427535 RepID=A0A939PLE4_9ACTN|nr:nitroreductase/quinone reductase family protein [Actinomadura barringtoniae]MBO2454228.1 nitroreductase family deazaflavin-dependent oxidoreductase [Actinomadura barringtoniae]